MYVDDFKKHLTTSKPVEYLSPNWHLWEGHNIQKWVKTDGLSDIIDPITGNFLPRYIVKYTCDCGYPVVDV